MAVVLAFRIGIALVPVAAKLLRNIQTERLDTYVKITKYARDKLLDPGSTDEELTALLSADNDYLVRVTTITGDFEVRRVQLEWSVTGTSLLDEDVRVCTFHHIKLSGGQPISTWDQADFDTLVTAYLTWWNSLTAYYHSGMILTGIKFYKAGPAILPPQPPVFDSVQNAPGVSGHRGLPPQVALSVTEIAGVKKGWGRFYLPSMTVMHGASSAVTTLAGRPDTAVMTDVADQTDLLYETALTANLPFVVYRPFLPADRPHEGATPLPERAANAQTVEKLQIDDVFDVIRRRRWETATLRVQRDIGSAQATLTTAYPQPEDEPDVSEVPPAAPTP